MTRKVLSGDQGNNAYAEETTGQISKTPLKHIGFYGVFISSNWNINNNGLFGSWGASEANVVMLRCRNRAVQMYRRDSSNVQTGPGLSGTNLSDNIWYRVAGWWDGQDLYAMVNGDSSGGVASTGAHDASAYTFRIGRHISGTQDGLGGQMNQAAVWTFNELPSFSDWVALTTGGAHPRDLDPNHYYEPSVEGGPLLADHISTAHLTLGSGMSYATTNATGPLIADPVEDIPWLPAIIAVGGTVFAKTSLDTFSLSDTGAETASFAAASADTFSLADASSETASFGVSASESLSFGDTGSETATLLLTLLDTLTLTDTASEIIGGVEKAVDDAMAFTDASSETAVFARTILDAIAFSDSAEIATKVIGKLVADSITFTDTATAEGGVQIATKRGGSSLTLAQMRRLERLQMLRRDDEEVVIAIMRLLK